MKKIIRLMLLLIGTVVLYVVLTLVHGTLTDFQPEPEIKLSTDGQGKDGATITRDSLTFLSWNIGYCGDGKESNFFYDNGSFFFANGKMVRPPKDLSIKNLHGISETVKQCTADFILIQEVDVDSRRGYHFNQYDTLRAAKPDYSAVYAVNFKSPRVPLPLAEPWNVIGKVDAGLGSFSRFQPSDATRYQYPGSFGWPERIFNLDRCASVQRYQTSKGHELVVINSHNSAYDKKGELKGKEMAWLKEFLLAEYAKGNYVIVGGDWNQCPPNFDYQKFMKDEANGYVQTNIPADYLPADWTYAYDANTPTNRKLADTYVPGKTFVTLIDFFVLSPNVELIQVKGVDNGFSYSDHQPVSMSIRLK